MLYVLIWTSLPDILLSKKKIKKKTAKCKMVSIEYCVLYRGEI